MLHIAANQLVFSMCMDQDDFDVIWVGCKSNSTEFIAIPQTMRPLS